MASSAARSASPTLASTLLGRERDEKRDATSGHQLGTGVRAIDQSLPSGLWAPGRVISVAGSEGRSGEVCRSANSPDRFVCSIHFRIYSTDDAYCDVFLSDT